MEFSSWKAPASWRIFALVFCFALSCHAHAGLPAKPAGIDDADWTSLQEAVAKVATEQARLTGDGSGPGFDGESTDAFGYSVALDGDTAIVGAFLDDIGAGVDQGSAYVFVRTGSTWSQQAKLTANDGPTRDFFGISVSLDGDTAVVGAYADDVGANLNQGSAYVFVRTGSTWTQQAKLVSDDGAADDYFGYAVALDGDTALIGAYGDDIGVNEVQGSAYVFVRSGAGWIQQAKLTADDGVQSDQLGFAVALDGDTALIGVRYDTVGGNALQGSAYVFVRAGSNWIQQARLVAGDGAIGDLFGVSVALDRDTAVIGAKWDDIGSNKYQGSVYVFVRTGTIWSQQAKLVAADGAAFEEFGSSVAINGETVLVGAERDAVEPNVLRGSAYVFVHTGGSWTQQAKLTDTSGAGRRAFGYSVALDGETALISEVVNFLSANLNQGTGKVFVRTGASWNLQESLNAGEGAAYDRFGSSVALDGDTALVGASGDQIGANFEHGSAFVFVRAGPTWILQAKLVPSDGVAYQQLGSSVALDGDTALVGPYVFVRTGSTWSQQAKLIARDVQSGDAFGFSVALHGDTALIGAYQDDIDHNVNQGSAYVFARTGRSWMQQAKLIASDGAATDQFGFSVALDLDTALIGAVQDDIGVNAEQGSAYVFVRAVGSWSQQARLSGNDGAAGDWLGASVALDRDIALIGAIADDIGMNGDEGSAYIFVRRGASWSQQAKLTAVEGELRGQFGIAVDLDGDTALIGAVAGYGGSDVDQGSAYLFVRTGSTWTQRVLSPSSGVALGEFGKSVALDGDTALIGAPGENGPGPYSNPGEGAAYVFVGLSADLIFRDGFE